MRYRVVKQVDHVATGAGWRAIREEAGVSLRNLAQTMGVSAPYLSDLERGRRNWSDEVENKYASALRVDRAVAQTCTCHERDSSYACPKCYAEGYRGHCQPQLVEFDSVREYRPEGREGSVVLVVECDRDREDLDDLSPHVKVDDEVYRVKGFETTGAPYRKGEHIGLVVDDFKGNDQGITTACKGISTECEGITKACEGISKASTWSERTVSLRTVVRFIHDEGFTIERGGRQFRADLLGKLLANHLHDQGPQSKDF